MDTLFGTKPCVSRPLAPTFTFFAAKNSPAPLLEQSQLAGPSRVPPGAQINVLVDPPLYCARSVQAVVLQM